MADLVESVRRGASAYAELLWPTRCVGCDLAGELLCEDCRATLPWIAQRFACPVCGSPFGHLTCTQCDRSRGHEHEVTPGLSAPSEAAAEPPESLWPMRATICSCSYEGAAARVVRTLKDAHELRLAPIMAAAMACALDEAASWDALDGAPRFDVAHIDGLCFVPATAAAYARRGFDHMELVCRALAAFADIPLYDVLARADARDQRSLGREGRIENLRGTARVVGDVAGLHLLLADDVVTTGSSLAETTRALLAAGAASVTCCAFARVW